MKKFYMALVSGGLLMAGCSEKAPQLGKAPIDKVIKAEQVGEAIWNDMLKI